jgi:6-phosphogluconolactonase (cycloisomerase 2 family)
MWRTRTPGSSSPATPFTLLASGLALSLAACSDATLAPESSRAPGGPTLDRADARGDGAVFTLTNDPARNAVIAFHRAADGSLTRIGAFATGGRGVGGGVDPLESQYALVLDEEHEALFAVDAGSNEVSAFRVSRDGSLDRQGTVSSGGTRPVSLAVHDKLLYALNTGDSRLQGFRVTGDARLVPLPGTGTSLAPGADGAAAVRFTPDGRFLVVSERVSNRLEVFPVRPNGRLGDPVVTRANGGASFGFDATPRGQLVVSETQGALTSYAVAAGGALATITPSISTSGAAACWVTITADGRFAFTTNAGSNTVAGFAVDAAGRLVALTPGAATGSAGDGASPIDLDHVGSRFLYTLEGGTGTIGTFVIDADGSLTARPDTPAGEAASGLQGIAAF